MVMGLSPVGASHLPYLRTEVAWSAPSGLNLRCGRVPKALPWAPETPPWGYCTGRRLFPSSRGRRLLPIDFSAVVPTGRGGAGGGVGLPVLAGELAVEQTALLQVLEAGPEAALGAAVSG